MIIRDDMFASNYTSSKPSCIAFLLHAYILHELRRTFIMA